MGKDSGCSAPSWDSELTGTECNAGVIAIIIVIYVIGLIVYMCVGNAHLNSCMSLISASSMFFIGCSLPLLMGFLVNKYPYGIGGEDSKYTSAYLSPELRASIEEFDAKLLAAIKVGYGILGAILVIIGIWKMFIL